MRILFCVGVLVSFLPVSHGAEPLLRAGAAAVDVVELWQANLYSLVDGDGSAVVTQAQVNAIETFLANLSAAGSAELQQLIAAELARLDPLDDYVGLTVKEAKRQAIGDATVYLPIVLK